MLKQAKRIYCIGIGGIGVSALAQLWRAQGKEVSGSDADTTGHRAENVGDVDLVVYSDAVPEDNVERAVARSRGIPEMSYAQALGEVSREYRTIVVTGTHGKSTTTAFLGLMLEAGGFDPLVIVGSKVPGWPMGNVRLPNLPPPQSSPTRGEEEKIDPPPLVGGVRGGGFGTRWFVVEGDDYRDHFLELHPYAVVVTNIEWDHPDYFRDLAHTVESFRKLVEKVPEDGILVINEDDAGCQQLETLLQHSNILKKVRMLRYGAGSEIFKALMLQVPGEFNHYNATAAATAAMELGVSRAMVEKVAHDFRGVWRRFEILRTLDPRRYTLDAPLIISDYAHHPTAIRATMKAAREAYPGRRLVLVYQPHQHSRTKHLFNDFVEVLKNAADVVIVSEIYAVKGRMEDQGINSQKLIDAISNFQFPISKILYGGDLTQTKHMVLEQIKPGDVVIFMGAGDIDNLARELVK